MVERKEEGHTKYFKRSAKEVRGGANPWDERFMNIDKVFYVYKKHEYDTHTYTHIIDFI